jgi:hypothetical protein
MDWPVLVADGRGTTFPLHLADGWREDREDGMVDIDQRRAEGCRLDLFNTIIACSVGIESPAKFNPDVNLPAIQ